MLVGVLNKPYACNLLHREERLIRVGLVLNDFQAIIAPESFSMLSLKATPVLHHSPALTRYNLTVAVRQLMRVLHILDFMVQKILRRCP